MNEQTCRHWRNGLAAVLSILVLALFHQLWIPRGIYLDFDYRIEKPLVFQAFYSHKHHTDGEYQYEKCALTKKQGHARVFLPVKRMDKFRLSLGKQPGKVELSNVTLQGRDIRQFNEQQPLEPSNIDTCKLQGNVYTAESEKRNPYLETTKLGDMAAGAFREVNVLNLLLLVFCPGYLFIVIWDTLQQYREGRTATEKRPSIQNIEFLRIVFTIGVLHYHFARNIGTVWSGGEQGVEFFFLLSGYLLALSYKPERSVLDVARRNWIRFVPLVVVGGLIAHGGWESFLGVFMLQNTGLAYMDVPNGPSWYIAVLFWCTLFYLGLLKALSEQTRTLAIGSLAFIGYLIVARTGDNRWQMVLEYLPCGMVRGIAGMGLGIVLGSICKRRPDIGHAKSLAYTMMEAACLVFILGSLFVEAFMPKHWIFLPLSHAILLVLFVQKRGYISSWLESPVWARVARYCLAIYLTHIFFLQWNHTFLWKIGSTELNILTAIAEAFALGILAYYVVEKPAVRYLQAWLQKQS